MANNTTTTNNILSSGELDKFIKRQAIDQFRKEVFFFDMGMQEDKPSGYNSVVWSLVDRMDFDKQDAKTAEGVVGNKDEFIMNQVEVTLEQLSRSVKLSDLILDDSYVDPTTKAATELGRQMAEVIDSDIQDTLRNGATSKNTIRSGGHSNTSSITASDTVTVDKLAQARSILKGKAAPTFGEGYVAVMHPDVIYDLFTQTSLTSFVEVNKYTQPDKIFNGEIGKLFGIRIIESANANIKKDAGSGSVDVYPTVIMGENAYGVAKGQNPSVFFKELGSAGTNDPVNQLATVGIKTRYGSAVLKSDSFVLLESASSIGSN